MVTVRRQWNGYAIAVPVTALRDFHVRQWSGGVQAKSPYPMLYARMWCTLIPEEDRPYFGHSCRHGAGPHEILVCITKKDNPRSLYKALRARAEQPATAT